MKATATIDPAASPKLKAYSYLRFSTPEQMKGDSKRRQDSLAEDYAARKGLTLDRELTFNDLGVSAYRGKNAEEGQLADFLKAVGDGVVPKGSYLLVESLDRVSRTTPRKAVRILENICEAGVNVVTLSDEKVYNEHNLDTDGGMSLIMSVLTFVRANEESAMKSRRLKSSWEGRREKAAAGTGPLTTWGPPWLRFDKDAGKWEIIDERADAVRLMFQLILSGMGVTSVTRELHRRGIEPFAKNSKGWNTGSVRYILNSPSTFGTLVPKTVVWDEDGRKKRYVEKEPVPDAFPAILSEETFHAVELAMRQRTPSVKEAPAAATFQNLFHRLAYCGACEALCHSVAKTTRGKTPRRALVCSNGRYGRGCAYVSIRMDVLEDALVRDAEVTFGNVVTGDGELANGLAQLDANIDGLESGIKTLSEGYQKSRSSTLLDALVAAEEELRTLKARRGDLAKEVDATSSELVEGRLAAARALLAHGVTDRNRAALHTILKQLVARVDLHAAAGFLTLHWRHGGEALVVFAIPAE